jgi:glutaminyl-peptide cyclotransferase
LPYWPSILAIFVGSRPNTETVRSVRGFNCWRAFDDLRRIVGFGPGPCGSQALERARQFIIGELRAAGLDVSEDRFTAVTPVGPIPMSNFVAKIPGTGPSIVIIGGHTGG